MDLQSPRQCPDGHGQKRPHHCVHLRCLRQSQYSKLSMTDTDGNTTRYQYDALYRLVLETNALHGLKHYFYDGEGDKIEFIDENGNPTFYMYTRGGGSSR